MLKVYEKRENFEISFLIILYMPPESKPEQYLREIRDLSLQNAQLQIENKALLLELVEKKRSQLHWQHWKTAGNIVIIILPYALSAYMTWLFYVKVQESIQSFTHAPQNAIESISSGVKNTWTNREELLETSSEKTKTKLESIKSYFTE